MERDCLSLCNYTVDSCLFWSFDFSQGGRMEGGGSSPGGQVVRCIQGETLHILPSLYIVHMYLVNLPSCEVHTK